MISSFNLNCSIAEALKEFGKMIDTVEDERDRMVSHNESFLTCSWHDMEHDVTSNGFNEAIAVM